jgi:hypothetical protein
MVASTLLPHLQRYLAFETVLDVPAESRLLQDIGARGRGMMREYRAALCRYLTLSDMVLKVVPMVMQQVDTVLRIAQHADAHVHLEMQRLKDQMDAASQDFDKGGERPLPALQKLQLVMADVETEVRRVTASFSTTMERLKGLRN